MNAWRNVLKLPVELWILCLGLFVNRLGTMVMPFMILYLTRSLGFPAATAAGILVIYGVTGLLMAPISGKLADSWGRLRVMKVSLVAFAVIVLLFPFARSLPAVVAMTILLSIGNESFRPAGLAAVGDLGGSEHRKAAFSLYRTANNLGISVGPLLGGLLARHSFHLLFVVDGLTTLAAAAILTFSRFDVRMKARDREGLEARKASEERTGWPLAALVDDPRLRVFVLSTVPVLMVFWLLQSPLPLYLVRDLHFPETAYGLVFTLNTLLIVTCEIPLNGMTARWPHRWSLVLGSTLFAVGFGLFAVTRTYLEIMVGVVIWTLGEMTLFPAILAYVSDLAPANRRAEYMGINTMMFSLAYILGPWFGALVLEAYGGRALWSAAFVTGMISAGLLAAVTAKRAVRHRAPAVLSLEDQAVQVRDGE